VETTILNLCSYAGAASELGFIREPELEHFLTELLPKIPHLRDIHDSFVPFYVFAASRRFFFFLDSRRRREVSIRKLGTSTCMEELLFLQRLSQYQGEDASEMGIADQLSRNWFWPANAQSQYRTYLNLDSDRNGTITKEDLLEYQGEGGGLQLTRLTVDRIFEENLTYLIDGRPEMDFKVLCTYVYYFNRPKLSCTIFHPNTTYTSTTIIITLPLSLPRGLPGCGAGSRAPRSA
jgi:serine/threonine-protein phosphatase 2A regulatory subunit B''